MPKELHRATSKAVTFLLMLVLIVAILSLGQHVLIPVVLGILFAFLLGPLVRAVQRWRLKRGPAVILVAVVAFVLFGILSWGISVQMIALAENMPAYTQITEKKIAALRRGNEHSFLARILGAGERLLREWSPAADKQKDQGDSVPIEVPGPHDGKPQTVVVQPSSNGTLIFVVGTARELLRIIGSVGVVVVMTIVTLIYKEELRDRFIRLTGSSRLTLTTKALDEAAKRISDYIFRKALVNSAYGIVIALGLLFLGVPGGVLWGFLIAVLRFIPSLGFWIGLIPPALLSLVAIEGWQTFFLVIVLFLATEVVASNVVESRFVGRQIGLLPVATLVSVSFWTWLWGPVGLLLGIPITLSLAVLGKYVPALDFLNVLLSEQPAMDPTMRYYQRLIANDQDEATDIVEHYLAGAAAESVYDDVLLPALSHAKRDVANSQLTTLDQEFFFRTTREILDNVCEPALAVPVVEPGRLAEVKIAGCPVGDENDLLALRMVNQQLRARGYQLALGAAGKLSSEVVDWVDSQSPDIVCLLSVAPGEMTQSRFLCKRLRGRFPDLKVVVARLGAPDDLADETGTLTQAGADEVCGTILDTTRQLMQLIQLVAMQKPKAEVDTSQDRPAAPASEAVVQAAV